MNVLDAAKRKQIVSALVEGNSIRATCRMTGAAKGTVLKLLVDLGTACRAYHDANVRGLSSQRVQCDEIWSFVGAKDKNVLPDEQRYGIGSIWTWTALDADSKLIAAYHVGTRDAGCAYEFMQDLASRIATRIQLTTDGHRAYINAVADAFGAGGVDYAMLVKLYGEVPAGAARYSPPACIGANLTPIMGEPDMAHVSTSHVERQNLTMACRCAVSPASRTDFQRRWRTLATRSLFTSCTTTSAAFTRRVRVTPAMAAGIAAHVWDIDELIALMPKAVAKPWGSVKRVARLGRDEMA